MCNLSDKPYFSVVIPAYNAENHIKRTLASVLQQSFSDFEIVVVNDGSTDNTTAVIKECADKRISIIEIENSGVSIARNTGIRHAKGKYIAFLDADDIWHPDRLQRAHAYFESNKDVLWYTSPFIRCSEDQIDRFPFSTAEEPGRTLNFFKCDVKPHGSCVIVSKSALPDEPLFPEGVKYLEDTIAWDKIGLRNPKIGFSQIPDAYYIVHENSFVAQLAQKDNNPCIDLSYFVNYIEFLTNELKKTQPSEAKHYIQFQFLLIIGVTLSKIFYHNATQKIMLTRRVTRAGMYISLCLLCLKIIICMIRLPYRIAKVARLLRLRWRLR